MRRSFGATLLVIVALLVGACAGHAQPSASPTSGATSASSSPPPASTSSPTRRPGGPVHVAWTLVPGNPFGDAQVTGIAPLDGRFIAWGEDPGGAVFYASPDGTSWAEIPAPGAFRSAPRLVDLGTTTVALGVDETGTVVAWAGSLAVGLQPVVAPALDRLADLRIAVVDDLRRLLVCGLGKADAAPVLHCVVTADGRTWVASDPPGATASAVGTGLPAGFALLGLDAGSITTWRTSDGRAWVRTDAVAEPAAIQGMHSVAGIAGGLVAGGSRWADDGSSAGGAWASAEGSLWRLVLTAAEGSVRVERVGDVALATASDVYCREAAVFASVDGIAWGRSPAPVPVCGSYAALGESIVALAPDDESGRTAVWQGRLTEGPGAPSVPSPASPAPATGPSFGPPSASPAATGLGLAWSSHEIGRGPAVVNDVATWSGGLVAIGTAHDASGTDRTVAWVSTDGRTWTPATMPPDRLPDETWAAARAVTAGGPGLVAVGWANVGQDANPRVAIWTSSDGLRWSRAPNTPGLALAPGVTIDFPERGPWDVAAWSGGLVAVGVGGVDGMSATIWTSPDGRTWTPMPDLPDAAMHWAYGVAEGPEGLVVVGGSGAYPDFRAAAWYSRDGLSWASASGPTGAGMESVIRWADRLVAVGGAPASWVSSDGRTWTGALGQERTRGVRLIDVAGVGDRLVALGFTIRDDGLLPGAWVSEDGLGWSQPPQAEVFVGADPAAITGFGGRVVVVGTVRDGDAGVPTAWISPP